MDALGRGLPFGWADQPRWENRSFSVHEWFMMNDPAFPAHLRPNWIESVGTVLSTC